MTEKRGDERFVVGVSADPQDPLRDVGASNSGKKQYREEKVDHAEGIRLPFSKRKNR